MPLRHIVVYGVGGVGGVIGGRIARYLEAHPESPIKLSFIARGEHLARIRERGLVVKSGDAAPIICRPAVATDRIEGLPPPDLVFVCVKSYDLDAVSRALAGVVTEKTLVIPLLNGVDIYDRVRKSLSLGIVLPSCIYIGTHIEEPGTVTHKGGEGRMLIGRDPLHLEGDAEEILRLFDNAGLPYRWFEDPFPAIWEKYIFIAAFALVTAASGKTLGEIMEDVELKGLTESIMEEIHGIARKKNIALPADIVSLSLAKGGNFPRETKTSYQRDLEQDGKPNEGDLFGGTIIRLGREAAVPTPVTEAVYARVTGKPAP